MLTVMLRRALPVVAGIVLVAIWWTAHAIGAFPVGTVPAPDEVARSFRVELFSGRLTDHLIASLYRVGWGFVLGAVAAIPLGLVIGRSALTRAALLPWINFFRSLSPIAWLPFAVIWFGLGDPPAIFILFLTTYFQLVLATAAAAAAVPRIYYRVAEDLGMSRTATAFQVTLPAVMPELVTALRIAIGVAWMVVVAAEMLGTQNGLGFLIIDARNGLRMDLVVVAMITIGAIGILLDVLFARLARVPMLRWGFDR